MERGLKEKRTNFVYRREMAIALVVYIALLFGAIRMARPMPEGVTRTLLLVSPIIGFFMMIAAIVRHVSRIDEYQRLRVLASFSIAMAITGAVTFTYGFLETAGFPRISMFAVWPIMGASWALVCGARALLNR